MLKPHTVFFIVSIFIVGDCSVVRFYSTANFEGLFYETEATSNCSNLAKYARQKAFSVNTDSCIIIFERTNCEGKSLKIPAGGESPIGQDLSSIDPFVSFHGMTSSFRACNETEGGTQVYVDIFKEQNFTDLQVSYKHICGCINLPNYAQRQVGSLDNHGNCVRIYFTQNCKGSFRELVAGKSMMSGNLQAYEHYAGYGHWKKVSLSEVVSLEPCDVPSDCLSLEAVAYKFEINPFVTEENFKNFVLAKKDTMRNNGTATVTREHVVKNSVKEYYQVKRGQSLTGISSMLTEHSSTGKISATFGNEAGVDFKIFSAKAKFELTAGIEETLRSCYTFTQQSGEDTAVTWSREVIQEFVVSEKIVVPPCTLYEVSSYVRMLQEVPVNYTVHLRVTGKLGSKNLSARELRKYISEMEDMEDIDEFTVKAKTEGFMTATLGYEGVIDGHGMEIENCRSGRTLKTIESKEIVTGMPVTLSQAGVSSSILLLLGAAMLTLIILTGMMVKHRKSRCFERYKNVPIASAPPGRDEEDNK